MDDFDGRYYKHSQLILGPIGLWPFDESWKRNTASSAYHLGTFSLAIFQFILLLQVWGKDLNIMIELIASIISLFSCLFKYQSAYFNSSKVKSLLTQMVKDWQGIKDENERKMLTEFYESGRLMSLFYIAYLFGAYAILHATQFLPPILDYVFPLENGTHEKIIMVQADYFFLNREVYHYDFCIYLTVVHLSIVSMIAGNDSVYVLATKHVCGLIAITGHRLNSIGKANGVGAQGFFDDKCVVNDIRQAVALHTAAIRYCIILEEAFSTVFLFHQMVAILVMAMTCFNVFFIPCSYFRMCQCICLGCGNSFYMLFLNWVGQEVIDGSEELINTMYCSEWYLISPKSRKLIVFTLIRLLHPLQLTAGKLVSLSVATYGQILRSTSTYVTVLLSVTQH